MAKQHGQIKGTTAPPKILKDGENGPWTRMEGKDSRNILKKKGTFDIFNIIRGGW